jgi:transcriptional regulator with XRE-family HTH domain
MKGLELRNFLYLNKISQDDAAQFLGVKRQTVNNWCRMDELEGRILTKAKLLIGHYSAEKNAEFANSTSPGAKLDDEIIRGLITSIQSLTHAIDKLTDKLCNL